MNTDKQKTLKQVRDTLNTVTSLLPDLPVNSRERDKLEDAVDELEALLRKMINEDIVGITNELQNSAVKLQVLSDNLKSVNHELNTLSDKIEKTSQIVKAIADVASFAGSSGLI
jgi:DNA repair ATPase RecN